MIFPIAFIGCNLSTNYLTEYLNIVFFEDIDTPWDRNNFLKGYELFFKDLDLELGKEIFIINTGDIDCPGKPLDPDSWVIGVPITNFSYALSIKRMCMDLYDTLTSIDLLVEEPLEIVDFMIFNMEL